MIDYYMKDTLDASNVQEFRGVLKRFMDGSFVRFAFYKGSEGNDNRHGAPGRFTTRDNDVRVHRSVVVHKFPAPPSPCTPYAHAYVRLCPCILINTLLTPRPRHINHETMENAVGGGPTGVDLSIPLSCIPPPPSPVYPRCVPRTPSVATMGHISLSLSLSNSNSCMRAISPRKVSTSIYCEISRERARLYRAKRLPVEEPAVVDRGVRLGVLTLR